MACGEYEGRLADLEDYVAGELQGPARTELTRHLAVCPLCSGEVAAARTAIRLLRGSLEPAAEPDGRFWQRVQAGIRREAARADFWGSLEVLARRLAWSAACAVLLLAGYLLMFDLERVVGPAASRAEAREIFPDPDQQPASQEEVLLTLAGNGR